MLNEPPFPPPPPTAAPTPGAAECTYHDRRRLSSCMPPPRGVSTVIFMEGQTRRFNVERVFSLGDDLIAVLNMKREIDSLKYYLEGAEALHSLCEAECHEVRSSLEDFNKKTETCKQQIDEAKDRTIPDAELDQLRNELKEELQNENMLYEELRAVEEKIGDLEHQRISVKEQRANMQKKDRDELRMQNTLFMCAQVTRTIPDLTDQTSISGCILSNMEFVQ